MLKSKQQIELVVERPAAGGRMIARHDGQIVLVSGAVPGERVLARVERRERRLAFATVVDIVDASPDRRAAFADPACAGCTYSHIAYERQLTLKADVVRDAFQRLGKIVLEAPVAVAASPEHHYRMRARLHVEGARVGFYREGTHSLCDASATGQLSADAMSAVTAAAASLAADGIRATAIELTENAVGNQRALMFAVDRVKRAHEDLLERLVEELGVTGCAAIDAAGNVFEAGEPFVADSLSDLSRGRVARGPLRRHAHSFFQANRYIVPGLVAGVLDAAADALEIIDLYAGVGLFSVALAGVGERHVTAVEGDPMSGADLEHNATIEPASSTVTVVRDSVERFLTGAGKPDVIVADPPRTGISADAMASLVKIRASKVVYVSCDPATMARDARRLLDAGYRLISLEAFDMFPNTPHVESLGVFVHAGEQ